MVTAENGDTKTYTVTAKVAQAPTLFLSFSGAKLGVVKDVEGSPRPRALPLPSLFPREGTPCPFG
ncbi:MAG: hypothetical protein ACLUNQ_01055 [Oscillospiraceae bacterium]